MTEEQALGDGTNFLHEPVMMREAVEFLGAMPGKLIVDATVGGGGHAAKILAATAPDGRLIGIDRDPDAVEAARSRLMFAGARVTIVQGRMAELESVLAGLGIERVDGILADLGVSSFQLDMGSRGFSFRKDAPLDMRMDPQSGESAAELLERIDEEDLHTILREFGEERFAGRIARALAGRRIESTGELAAAVIAAVPAQARRLRIHPATRVFQAIRIAVNDEMGELDRFLTSAPKILTAGGRLVVLSYHSLEDRRVKHAFRRLAAEGDYSLPVRKAVKPGEAEVRVNPRARSAKLRVLERL
ncbi:MAG: 16S rRNA (cytosine(1402)-N(4))-methyltransferase RsmH [bacterium]